MDALVQLGSHLGFKTHRPYREELRKRMYGRHVYIIRECLKQEILFMSCQP